MKQNAVDFLPLGVVLIALHASGGGSARWTTTTAKVAVLCLGTVLPLGMVAAILHRALFGGVATEPRSPRRARQPGTGVGRTRRRRAPRVRPGALRRAGSHRRRGSGLEVARELGHERVDVVLDPVRVAGREAVLPRRLQLRPRRAELAARAREAAAVDADAPG